MRLLTWLVATCLLIDVCSTRPDTLQACKNEIEVLKLLQRGTDPNVRDAFGRTLLHTCKNENVARLLLDWDAEVNARDNWDLTPLHCNKDPVTAELLLRKKADPNARNDRGNTPLYYYRDEKIVRLLLQYGADVNNRNQIGRTPLHYCKDVPIARLLLTNGADLYIRDHSGETPFHCCYNADIARIMLEHCADVHVRDNSGNTPLHLCRNIAISRVLLENGSDVKAINEDGDSALHYAARYEEQEHAQLLLEYGSNPNLRNLKGFTPLHEVSCNMGGGTVEVLIDGGANIMARTTDGLTPLHISAKYSVDPSKLIASILKQGLDIDTTDNEGRTALHYAVESSCPFCVDRLIVNRASINAADKKGRTPWYLAIITRGSPFSHAVKNRFFCAGGSGAAKFFDGSMPLHLLARYGAYDVEEAVGTINYLNRDLRERGFDVDILDENGMTPLFVAMNEDELEADIAIGVVRHLLAKEASIEHAFLIDQKVLGKFFQKCHRAEIDCADVVSHVQDLANKLFSANLPYSVSDFVPKVVEEYQIEVERLKKTEIYEGISHYNFLLNENPLTSMLDKNNLANLPVDFPAYGNLLKSKIKLQSYRAELLIPARLRLLTYFKNSQPRELELPSEIIDEILFCLTNTELLKFARTILRESVNSSKDWSE